VPTSDIASLGGYEKRPPTEAALQLMVRFYIILFTTIAEKNAPTKHPSARACQKRKALPTNNIA
jgi:hypothetical protein